MQVLTDADVERVIDRRAVIEVIRGELIASVHGERLTPPRAFAEVGDHNVVLTAGGAPDWIGFRAYGRPGMREEITAVWDRASGALDAVVVGRLLGPLRTASLGAAAIDVMARRDARSLTMIGSGKQARAALHAAAQVRDFERVVVTSPTVANREDCARWARETVGLDAVATDDVRAAVEAADVVVCATKSQGAVLESDWVQPGTHVSTLGPRWKGESEIPLELVERAEVLATDSPGQMAALGDRYLIVGSPAADRVAHVGALAEDASWQRGADDVSVYLSMGLAGTEVAIARWFASQV